MTKKDNNDN